MSFLTISPRVAPSIPRDGLNFWFDAQNHPSLGNADIAVDRTLNYPNYTLVNSGVKVAYNIDGGGSFDFSGDANSYVKTPISVSSTNTVTWALWFRRNTATPTAYTGLFYNRTTGATAGVHFGGSGNSTKLRYTWNNAHFDVETNLVTPQDVWTFCSVVVRSNGATLTMISATGSKSTYTHTSVTNAALSLTSSFLGWDGFSTRLLNGRISQAFFYTRDLSDAEVQTLYDATISRHYPLGLPATTTTTTTTTTSTTTVAPYYKFTGVKGSDSSEACGGGEADDAYSNVTWAGLKANDVLFEDSSLTVTWQKSQFFKKDDENQWIEIDTSNGKVLGKPADCK